MDRQHLANIWTLSSLDQLMHSNKQNGELFIAAFDRKEMLLRLIRQYKIDAKRYFRLTSVATKEEGSLVRECAQRDLESMRGKKEKLYMEEWFKKMIENAKVGEEKQHQQYLQHLGLKQISHLRVTKVKEVQEALQALRTSKIVAKK